MTWAKLDDRFHEHRKVKEAWRADPAAIGLHVMAITYCAGHELDGRLDRVFVHEKLPKARDRDRAVGALVEAGLWVGTPDGWLIHDYLVYNPSRADLDAKRARDAERKARGRSTQSAKRPTALPPESARTPEGVRDVSSGPDPTRPDPKVPPSPPSGGTPPLPGPRPGGKRARDRAAWEQQVADFAAAQWPEAPREFAVSLVGDAIGRFTRPGQPATVEDVCEWVMKWAPRKSGFGNEHLDAEDAAEDAA